MKKLLALLTASLLAFSPAAYGNGSGPVWGGGSGSGGGSPAGANGAIQINYAGAFAGLIGSPYDITDPDYGATANTCDGLEFYNGAVTSHGNQLTISGYTFTAADDGKAVGIDTPPLTNSGTPFYTPVFVGTLTHNSNGTATLSGNQTGGATTGFRVRFGFDDTTVIQNVFNSAASAAALAGTTQNVTGEFINFPDNHICIVTAGINFYTRQAWGRLTKGGTRLIWLSPSSMGTGITNYAMFVNTTGNGSTRTFNDNVMENFEIDEDDATCSPYTYHCKAIEAQYMVRPIIHGMYIHGTPATSIGPDFVAEGHFYDNVLENCGRLWSGSSSGGACMAWEMVNGSYLLNQPDQHTIVENNTFYNPGSYAIESEASNTTAPNQLTGGRNIFSNNMIISSRTTGNGIALVGSTNDEVTGNTCVNKGTMTSGACVNIFGGVVSGPLAPGVKTLVANNQSIGWYEGFNVQEAQSGSTVPADITLQGNKAYSSVDMGFRVQVSGSNTVSRLTLNDNTATSSGSAGFGFVNSGTPGTIAGLTMAGNVAFDNAATTGTDVFKSGFYFGDNITSGTFGMNTALDDGTGTQKYGVTYDNGATVTFDEGPNNFAGNTTAERNLVSGTVVNGTLFRIPRTVTGTISGAAIATNFNYSTQLTVYATLTHSASTAISNPTNPQDNGFLLYVLTQDGTGSNAITWGNAFDFGATGSPTLSTGAGKVDYIGFRYNATLSKWVYQGLALGN